MFLQIGLPRQPFTVIYEKVMNSNDVSVLLSILCNGRGEHPGWCEATDYFIRWSWLVWFIFSRIDECTFSHQPTLNES